MIPAINYTSQPILTINYAPSPQLVLGQNIFFPIRLFAQKKITLPYSFLAVKPI